MWDMLVPWRVHVAPLLNWSSAWKIIPATRMRLMDGYAWTKSLLLSQFAWISLHIFIQALNPLVRENYHTSWWQIFVVMPNIYLAHEHTFTLPSRAAASLHDQTSHDVCVFSTPHLLPLSKRTHRRSHLEAMQSNQFRFNFAPSAQIGAKAFSFNRPQLRKREPAWSFMVVLGNTRKVPKLPTMQSSKKSEDAYIDIHMTSHENKLGLTKTIEKSVQNIFHIHSSLSSISLHVQKWAILSASPHIDPDLENWNVPNLARWKWK